MSLSITPSISLRYAQATNALGSVVIGKGVLPLVVQATARGTTANSTTGAEPYPSHTVNYEWDFGDPTSTELFIDPVTQQSVSSNDKQIGPEAAHCYTTAGVYTIRLRCNYRDAATATWITIDATTTLEVVTPASVGWTDMYVDTTDSGSLNVGTLAEPYNTLAALRTALLEKDRLNIYIAAGNVIQASDNAPVLTLTRCKGVRIGKYTPVGSSQTVNPVLRLASGASSKPVVSVVADATADSANEVQVLTLTGAVSGNFTLTFRGNTTPNIAYNASATTGASSVRALLEGLASIGVGNVAVTGSDGGPYTITFQSALAAFNVPLLVVGAGSPALNGGATTAVAVSVVGSIAHTKVDDVCVSNVSLDANNRTGSSGIAITVSGTPGAAEDVYFRDVTISNFLTNGYYVATNGSMGLGTGLGLIRVYINATGAAGHTVDFPALRWRMMLGCSVVGGNGDEAVDAHVKFTEIGTAQLQDNTLLRWNALLSGSKKMYGLYVSGGSRRMTFVGNYFTGTREGLFVDRETGTQAIPTDWLAEGNVFYALGTTAYTRAVGVHTRKTSNYSIRNNVMSENGFANGQAQTDGYDIWIDDAAAAEGSDVGPLRIYHNSIYRSYSHAGCPLVYIDDLRYIDFSNNAIHNDGGVGVGTDPLRAIVHFTSASYSLFPRNERQLLSVTGSPTGGTFRLTFTGKVASPIAGQQTAALAATATAADVQAALEGLAAIVPGDVTVTGGTGGPWTVEFMGAFGSADISALTVQNALTGGTTPTVTVSTSVAGTAGVVKFNGNVYYSPNMVRGGIVTPFVVNGTTPLAFDAASGADWRNGGNASASASVDVNGRYVNPGFRNPKGLNFTFGASDPLADSADASRLGIRYDFRRAVRGSSPDSGAYEFTGESSNTPFVYSPAPLTGLPTAAGVNYNGGDILYIQTNEPVRAIPGDASDVDNRPHAHLAHRDNVIAATVDGVLLDVNNAFCQPPQFGSRFITPHTSIADFIRQGHNPDGTLKLDNASLASLGFLRIDGSNSMLSNLDFGGFRGRNIQQGSATDDATTVGQAVLRNGTNSVTGTLAFENNAQLNMGGSRVTSVGTGASANDATNVAQTMLRNGVNSMLAPMSMGGFNIRDVRAGVLPTDGVNVSQLANVSNLSSYFLSGTGANGVVNALVLSGYYLVIINGTAADLPGDEGALWPRGYGIYGYGFGGSGFNTVHTFMRGDPNFGTYPLTLASFVRIGTGLFIGSEPANYFAANCYTPDGGGVPWLASALLIRISN